MWLIQKLNKALLKYLTKVLTFYVDDVFLSFSVAQ